jgi:hypothetical protein
LIDHVNVAAAAAAEGPELNSAHSPELRGPTLVTTRRPRPSLENQATGLPVPLPLLSPLPLAQPVAVEGGTPVNVRPGLRRSVSVPTVPTTTASSLDVDENLEPLPVPQGDVSMRSAGLRAYMCQA